MMALLGGTFAFFWTHSALWFYREYQDRKQGKSRAACADRRTGAYAARASTSSACPRSGGLPTWPSRSA